VKARYVEPARALSRSPDNVCVAFVESFSHVEILISKICKCQLEDSIFFQKLYIALVYLEFLSVLRGTNAPEVITSISAPRLIYLVSAIW